MSLMPTTPQAGWPPSNPPCGRHQPCDGREPLEGRPPVGIRPTGSVGTPQTDTQSGQVMPLAVFLFLVVAMLVFMVFNTGQALSAKMEAQTAADISAHAGGLWMCRGLNLIARNNRACGDVLARIPMLRAIDRALDLAVIAVEERRVEAAALIVAGQQTGNPQLVLQGLQILLAVQREEQILTALRSVLPSQVIADFTADQSGTLWAVARSLELYSSALASRVPVVAATRAVQLGRYNTDSQGGALLLAPTWMALPYPVGGAIPPDGRVPVTPSTGTNLPQYEAGTGLPVQLGQFEDWREPLTTGRPPYPQAGRVGLTRPGPYNRASGQVANFFRDAMPLTVGGLYEALAQEEFEFMITGVQPGNQNSPGGPGLVAPAPAPVASGGGTNTGKPGEDWKPRPMVLRVEVRYPREHLRNEDNLKHMAVWAVAWRRAVAPIWTRRFTNPVPVDLALATARVRVTNPRGWDLWTPQWQVKLTHADWTYDRDFSALAVGPELLATNLLRLLDTTQYDRLVADGGLTTPWYGRQTPGPDSREFSEGRDILSWIAQGGINWTADQGRWLIYH